MSRLSHLLRQVEQKDPQLAADLAQEVKALSQRRQFGLNFERHTPETVELYRRPIRKGDKVRFVAPRGESPRSLDRSLWKVVAITRKDGERIASLVPGVPTDPQVELVERAVEDLVVVAEFRDPIYPGLVSTGRVERGEDKPFHTVINAENFHALQLLLYTHEGKVDAIYIDPPYNTRDKTWKYNNDYVDSDDIYRHSKWLAFMERRLKLARRLLNPRNSMLIVTIDEKEYLRLGLLLQQTFPGVPMQMVSVLINAKGTGRTNELRRIDEYAFFLRFGDAAIEKVEVGGGAFEPADVNGETAVLAGPGLDWQTFRRRDLASRRGTTKGGPRQFYPIYVNETSGVIESVGDPLPHNVPRDSVPTREGCVAVFPVRPDGTPNGIEMNWSLTRDTFLERLSKGYIKVGRHMPGDPQPFVIQYLKSGSIEDIESGRATVTGRNPDGSVAAIYEEERSKMPTTQWRYAAHSAEHYGTGILKALIPGRDFPFPKSLHAVEDCLRLHMASKPDGVVVDFFSGSGTTAHAVMRLNRQDDGRRTSISVTNNEVSADEELAMRKRALRPGDPEWEALGVCEYITKPRVTAAVTGLTPEGKPIKGDYKFIDDFAMAEGFEENVEFFTLTYEAPRAVAHHRSFEAVAPLLWLRAGARGSRIDTPADDFALADAYAVLFDPDYSREFLAALYDGDGVRTVFIVTDDDRAFQMVCAELPAGVETVRLYSSYLTNFTINTGRE